MRKSLKDANCADFGRYVAENVPLVRSSRIKTDNVLVTTSNASAFFGDDDWIFVSTVVRLDDITRRRVYTGTSFVPRLHTVADICKHIWHSIGKEMETRGVCVDQCIKQHIVFTESVVMSLLQLLSCGKIAVGHCQQCRGLIAVTDDGEGTKCARGCPTKQASVNTMVREICNSNGIDDSVYFVAVNNTILVRRNVFSSHVAVDSSSMYVEWYYNKHLESVIK